MNYAELLSNFSLRMRNPIGGIVSHTQELLQTKLDPSQREFVKTIDNCCVEIVEMLNNVLDYVKIDSGQITNDKECFSLVEIWNSLKETLQHRLIEKNLKLTHIFSKEIPDYIVADKNKIVQILTNILNCVVKFGLENNKIVVAAVLMDEKLEFSIQTDTIDIDVDFTPCSDTGLELAVAQKLVKFLGGKIEVSKNSQATIFRFSLGFENHQKFLENRISLLRGILILMVIEDIEQRVMVGDLLFEIGVKPIGVATINDAQRYLSGDRYKFAAIIVDQNCAQWQPKIPLIGLYSPEEHFKYCLYGSINKIKLIEALYRVVQIEQIPETILIVDSSYYGGMIAKMLVGLGYKNIQICGNENILTTSLTEVKIAFITDISISKLLPSSIKIITVGENCQSDNHLYKPIKINQLKTILEKIHN